ncbi:MAG: 16S rRNA (guanine(527)-N(7))-methyltransferase RsmG [Candidatus Eisenbacteria bacterium]|nr:16S rRNA (guanine(527)-N(7))-methyltransferase RsmG [Candidatus Eisenbacteria bacterium]
MSRNPSVFGDDELRMLREISRVIDVPVPPSFRHSSETFLAELVKWNRRINLISARDEDRVVERHLLDSLCLLSVERDLSGKKLLDVGSGAGFPGVVLAMWEPNCQAVLVESKSKKVAFLNAVRRRLALDNVRVVHSRVERLCEGKEIPWPVDLVVSRGVGGVVALAASLGDILAERGSFVLYKGAGAADELRTSKTDVELNDLGFEVETVKPAWQKLTTLVVLKKTRHQ